MTVAPRGIMFAALIMISGAELMARVLLTARCGRRGRSRSLLLTSPYPLTSTFIVSPKALLSFSRNLKPTFLAAITRASSSGLAPLYLRILGSFSSTSTSTVWFRASDVKNSLIASDSGFGCSSGGDCTRKRVRACSTAEPKAARDLLLPVPIQHALVEEVEARIARFHQAGRRDRVF